MNAETEKRISELLLERQLQDRLIKQLRDDCKELKSQTLKVPHNKSSSTENGKSRNIEIQVKQLQLKLQKMQESKKRFDHTKGKLFQTIFAVLQNLQLECVGLRFTLTQNLNQMHQELITYIQEHAAKELKLTQNAVNQNSQNHYDLTQNQHKINQVQLKFQDQIQSLQVRVDKLTYQLQESEQSEINLIDLNKRQMRQIDNLRQKLRTNTDLNQIHQRADSQLSRTTTEWNIREDFTQQNNQLFQNQFSSTQPIGKGFLNKGPNRSSSQINRGESPDLKKLKQNNDDLESKFQILRSDFKSPKQSYQFSSSQKKLDYSDKPKNKNDNYYNRLASKYVYKGNNLK